MFFLAPEGHATRFLGHHQAAPPLALLGRSFALQAHRPPSRPPGVARQATTGGGRRKGSPGCPAARRRPPVRPRAAPGGLLDRRAPGSGNPPWSAPGLPNQQGGRYRSVAMVLPFRYLGVVQRLCGPDATPSFPFPRYYRCRVRPVLCRRPLSYRRRFRLPGRGTPSYCSVLARGFPSSASRNCSASATSGGDGSSCKWPPSTSWRATSSSGNPRKPRVFPKRCSERPQDLVGAGLALGRYVAAGHLLPSGRSRASPNCRAIPSNIFLSRSGSPTLSRAVARTVSSPRASISPSSSGGSPRSRR